MPRSLPGPLTSLGKTDCYPAFSPDRTVPADAVQTNNVTSRMIGTNEMRVEFNIELSSATLVLIG